MVTQVHVPGPEVSATPSFSCTLADGWVAQEVPGALAAFDDFSVAYQPAADDPRPLFRRVSR